MPKFLVTVVSPRTESMLDPEAVAVLRALKVVLGFPDSTKLRMARCLLFEIESASESEARRTMGEVIKNPTIFNPVSERPRIDKIEPLA